jgi:hypothetical protein
LFGSELNQIRAALTKLPRNVRRRASTQIRSVYETIEAAFTQRFHVSKVVARKDTVTSTNPSYVLIGLGKDGYVN